MTHTLFQDQNLSDGDSVLTFNPDTDTEWMSEEEAGEIEIHQVAWARRVLDKADDDEGNALFEDESPELYERVEEPTSGDKEFWRVEEAITLERKLLREALAIGDTQLIPWQGKITSWGVITDHNNRPVLKQGKVQWGVQTKTVKGMLTQNQAWKPINMVNRKEARLKRDLCEAQQLGDKGCIRWCKLEMAAFKDAHQRFFYQYLYRALEVTKATKPAREEAWGKRNSLNEGVKEMAAEVEHFWWRRRLITSNEDYLNTWGTSGEVGPEFDDFLIHSLNLNRGDDLAWDHIRAMGNEEYVETSRWGYYERSNAGKVIEDNRAQYQLRSESQQRFYLVLGICKRSKGAISENRGLLDRLAEEGKVYWWVKPDWYANGMTDQPANGAIDPGLQEMWDELSEYLAETGQEENPSPFVDNGTCFASM